MPKYGTFVVSNDKDEIKGLVKVGYIPIECSIGGESIVDNLKLDHHGDLSSYPPVSVSGYDKWGIAKDKPGVVCAGNADADACFCAAAILGLIPHPSFTKEGAPPPVVASWKKNLNGLAETIGIIDTDPIGKKIRDLPGGPELILWNTMSGNGGDSLGFASGVGLWRTITTSRPEVIKPMLDAASAAERDREVLSNRELEERGCIINDILVIRDSRIWGFNEWYGRLDNNNDPTDPKSWKHPVVVALVETTKNITIGCPNNEVAIKLFGSKGLMELFPKLKPEGWGGRESVGGSPRGMEMTWESVLACAKTISQSIK